MNTVNEGGPDKGRFLYRTHETTTNAARVRDGSRHGSVAFRCAARRLGALRLDRVDAVEHDPGGRRRSIRLRCPTRPCRRRRRVSHIEIDPATGAAIVRPALGAMAHEGLRIGVDGNVYEAEDDNPGYIYKFVPDRPGDLSSGQLYALKITQDLGDRTGNAEWIALDRNAVQVNAVDEAAAKGATGYGDPEDLEIGTSTGNDRRGNHTLFVAISAEDRVLAVNLNASGPAHLVVSDYVRKGVNAPSDFDSPDNVALDKSGNLYITEDPGGSAPSKTLGDDVWFAPFNPQSGAQALPVQRFFSITDCNAEPTGLYMSLSNRTLFVDIQHRGGDGADLSVAIQRLPDVSFNKTKGN